MKGNLPLSLFDYPDSPGWKNTDTSREAAEEIAPSVETLRDMCFQRLKVQDLSADQIAAVLDIDKLSIRPRLTELKELGIVRDSGKRTLNKSGRKAIVWTLCSNTAA